MSSKLILATIIAYKIYKRRHQRQRSVYIRGIFNNRDQNGESHLIKELRDDPEYHHKYFRMKKESFDEIFKEIKDGISHSPTHSRPIPEVDRLAITLRFLATGNSQVSLAINYRISPSSVGKILRETMEVICEKFEGKYLKELEESDWTNIEREFKSKWHFPNCIGAMDGKHVRIKSPGSGSNFYNYKNYFSIVLFAVADASYRFSLVDIGRPGSNSDGGILMRSTIGSKLDKKAMKIPKSKALPNGEVLPHVILGDDGLPLKSYLMRPYPGKYLGLEERVFNYRLSRARMVVENAFGILAARWRIFHKPIEGDVYLANLITKTAIILHNFLMTKKDRDNFTLDTEDDGQTIRGNWRNEVEGDSGMVELGNAGSNNYSKDAFE